MLEKLVAICLPVMVAPAIILALQDLIASGQLKIRQHNRDRRIRFSSLRYATCRAKSWRVTDANKANSGCKICWILVDWVNQGELVISKEAEYLYPATDLEQSGFALP